MKKEYKRLVVEAFGSQIEKFYLPALAGDKIDFLIFSCACRLISQAHSEPVVAAIGFRLAEIGYSHYTDLGRIAAKMRQAAVDILDGKDLWVLDLKIGPRGGVK